MKLDLSVCVKDEVGNPIRDEKGVIMPLFHWVRMSVLAQLEDDPKNLEHTRKLQTIFAKLERSQESKVVEFKNETVTFIRERMIKCKMHLLILRAMELVVDGEPTEAALDAI